MVVNIYEILAHFTPIVDKINCPYFYRQPLTKEIKKMVEEKANKPIPRRVALTYRPILGLTLPKKFLCYPRID